jgi:hypothetical protein
VTVTPLLELAAVWPLEVAPALAELLLFAPPAPLDELAPPAPPAPVFGQPPAPFEGAPASKHASQQTPPLQW